MSLVQRTPFGVRAKSKSKSKPSEPELPTPPPLVNVDPFYLEMEALYRQALEAKRRGSLTRGQRMRTGRYLEASGGKPEVTSDNRVRGEVVMVKRKATQDSESEGRPITEDSVRQEQDKLPPEESLTEEAREELEEKREDAATPDMEKPVDPGEYKAEKKLATPGSVSAGSWTGRFSIKGFKPDSKEYKLLVEMGYEPTTYEVKEKTRWYGRYKWRTKSIIKYEDYEKEYARRLKEGKAEHAAKVEQYKKDLNEYQSQLEQVRNLGG